MIVDSIWCVIEGRKGSKGFWFEESRRGKTGCCWSVTSVVALAFGRYSARLGLSGRFGSACSAIAPSLVRCSVTLSPGRGF